MPNYTNGDSKLESITIEGVDKVFVISNPSLEAIHFNKGLIGTEFSQACLTASKAFLFHFKPELEPLLGDVAELVILSKGLVYRFGDAFAQVFNRNLDVNFVATRRVQFDNESAKIDVSYANLDAPAENLIIGDVIATGDTACAALARYLDTNGLKRVFMFSLSGSVIGARKLSQFCQSRNVELTLVYALGAFGLGQNGFDLSFLHPDTITSQAYLEQAKQVYGGLPISSVGWDCGTQVQATRKYKMLCWIEAKYWGLDNSPIFPVKEFPSDLRLVEKERHAYEERVRLFRAT